MISTKRRRIRPAWGFLMLSACGLALGLGCAKTGPPGGGPKDATPPEVVETVPSAGEVGVDRLSEIQVEFSEEMNRQTVEKAFSISPPVELKNLRWDGHALLVPLAAGLPESSTVVVKIADSAVDYHGVAMEEPFSLAFSTGSTVDTGVIEGEVIADGEPVSGAVVWACLEPGDGDEREPCGYAGLTSGDGRFRLENIRSDSRPYVVTAFVDENGDGVYSVAEEPGRIADAAAVIDSEGVAATGLTIELRTPEGE